MPSPSAARRAGGAAAVVLVALAGGCSGPPAPTAPAPTASSPAPAPSPLPPDGVRLSTLGYSHGPLDTFSLPRSSVLRAAVDQADNVTVVLSAPGPAAVAGYLRRTLPGAGFRVTADADDTLTFTGQGWSGSVTGTAGTTAVLLRPG